MGLLEDEGYEVADDIEKLLAERNEKTLDDPAKRAEIADVLKDTSHWMTRMLRISMLNATRKSVMRTIADGMLARIVAARDECAKVCGDEAEGAISGGVRFERKVKKLIEETDYVSDLTVLVFLLDAVEDVLIYHASQDHVHGKRAAL